MDSPGRAVARLHTVLILLVLVIPTNAMAIEEPKYTVIEKDHNFKVRLYEPTIVAETVVDTSDFDEASNEGFWRLAGYIFGGNKVRQKITMTSPVTTEQSQEIAMTAPVESEQLGGSVRVAFTMPSECTLEALLVPDDSRVILRQKPQRKFAAIKFSGRWTEGNFREHTDDLTTWFVPSFLRRNEILMPVE